MSLTREEAIDLIKSGYSWVREFRSDTSQPHFGGSKLLAIDGDYGIIKPSHRHRKTERVPLANISPWKSKNESLRQQYDNNPQNGNEKMKSNINIANPEFKRIIIDSQAHLVWSGNEQGFISDLGMALGYNDSAQASRAIGGIKRGGRSDRAQYTQIVSYPEAKDMIKKYYPDARPSIDLVELDRLMKVEKPKEAALVQLKPHQSMQAATKPPADHASVQSVPVNNRSNTPFVLVQTNPIAVPETVSKATDTDESLIDLELSYMEIAAAMKDINQLKAMLAEAYGRFSAAHARMHSIATTQMKSAMNL